LLTPYLDTTYKLDGHWLRRFQIGQSVTALHSRLVLRNNAISKLRYSSYGIGTNIGGRRTDCGALKCHVIGITWVAANWSWAFPIRADCVTIFLNVVAKGGTVRWKWHITPDLCLATLWLHDLINVNEVSGTAKNRGHFHQVTLYLDLIAETNSFICL
jgi:hypothetical protein